ncbi:MAG: hypothetical protein LUD68_09305 [Rikenellaceae bacterium]|nr:hypothetical protein [Rikenellaceae bacterium]
MYHTNESDLGITDSYYYDKTAMIFSDGYLSTISLSDNRFSIFTSRDGGLKVGDPVQRITELGIGTLIRKDDRNYQIRVEGIDDLITIRAESGIITLILYILSV